MAEQVDLAESADGAPRWLGAAAAPGRNSLRLAALSQVLETVFIVVQWAGLAWIAEGMLRRQARLTWPELSVLVAGAVLAVAAAWSNARFQAAGRRRISHAIRQRLVAGLLPSRERQGEPDAALAALATVELTDDVADYHAQALPQRLSAPVSMAVVFLVTAAVHWPAAVILLVSSLLIPLNMRLAGIFAKEGADEGLATSTRLGAVVLDSFRGLRTLQSIGALTRRRDELADAAARLNATTMATVRRAFLSGSVMDVVITFSIAVNATYVGLSLLGYVRLGGAPTLTLFSGLLVLLLCPLYFQPLRAMATAYHTRERALSAVPTIVALLPDSQTAQELGGPSARASGGPVEVIVDDVTFQFPDSDQPVLHGVAMTAHRGSWTAIAGPSGVGKTTLLSLIAGSRRPTSGTVRWITAAGALPPHLGGCSWIGQQTVLLPASISDNIRIGRPAAGQTEVERAVVAAGLADVVARLPQGLDTVLGEGGAGLSTGEARRIAIARAFLSDAELWILDEPTAHLDPGSEAQVIDALRCATQGRTVVVATHSAALARSADTVLIVADGTIQARRKAVAA
jgi:ATP-binding cassette subfamily C protein CydD